MYWAALPGEAESPLGAPFADARTGQAYHGYLYRVLSAQGKDAPGGAKSYVRDGLMTDGYALDRLARALWRHGRDELHRQP